MKHSKLQVFFFVRTPTARNILIIVFFNFVSGKRVHIFPTIVQLSFYSA